MNLPRTQANTRNAEVGLHGDTSLGKIPVCAEVNSLDIG